MKFREIFRFELAYQLSRVSTRLFFAIFLLLGAGVIRIGSSAVPLNAPSMIAFFTVGTGVIWLLLGAAVAGDAAARDHETRVHPLMFSAPLTRADYLGGRFLAALLINALVLLMVPAGMLLSLYLPGISPEARGPFRAAGYLTAYGFIALPNVFVATVVQFAAAAQSRRAISGYLGKALFILMVSNMVSTALGGLSGNWSLAKLFDLMGLVGISARSWRRGRQSNRGPGSSRWRGCTSRIGSCGWRSGWQPWRIRNNRFRFAHPVAVTRRKWFGRRQPDTKATGSVPSDTALAFRVVTPTSSPPAARRFGTATFCDRQVPSPGHRSA